MPTRPKTHYQRTKGKENSDRWYEQKRKDDPALSNAKKIRNSRRWQRVRKMFLSDHPVCQDPFMHHRNDGQVIPSKEVHHVVSLVEAPHRAFDFSNLQALCVRCHNMAETQGRGGYNR